MTEADLFDQCLAQAAGIVSSYRARAHGDPQNKGGAHAAQRNALAEQRAAREQSAEQFKIQMAMMAEQQAAAEANRIKIPTPLPAAPPQNTNDATIDAARDQKRTAQRRFSFNSARMASNSSNSSQTLGAQPVLGGYKAGA